jgi:hypothetical protein
MTYTINGKKWTGRAINVRCAQLEGKNLPEYQPARNSGYNIGNEKFYIGYNPCNNPSDTDAIIDKCLDKLLSNSYESLSPHTTTKWGCLMERHNCTKLVAACICYIEINEAAS